MGYWGKVIGGVAGFAIGGPIGALLGGLGGHLVDKLRSQAGDGARLGAGSLNEAARQSLFAVTVIVLSAKLAKADGVVTADEIATFKRIFRVPPEDMKQVADIWNRAKEDAQGFEPYARQAAELFRNQPAVLEELLNGLYHIAMADGEYHPAEEAFLKQVATIFGFDERILERFRAGGGPGAGEVDPYVVLGVERSASDDEIKSHYRKLVRENHPDRLMAEGLPPDCIDMANEKLAGINAAYDRIRKERGLT